MWAVNLQLLSMEIDLNKEESTETSQFINFSIREYVAEIGKKNPAKCWPFGSLRDPENKVVSSYQSSEAAFLSGQNCPSDINGSEDITELKEAPNLPKVETFNGKDDQPETTTDNGSSELTSCNVNNGQNRHENNANEGVKIRHNVAADNNEAGRTRPQRKTLKFRLLSDIYKDPASELRAGCDRTNPENVNKRFVAETEDESDDDDDDVTLAAYFRKQKGVERTDSTLKKKRDVMGVKEPGVDHYRKSNHGSKTSTGKDSNVGTSRKKSRTDDMDAQTMPEHEKITPSTSLVEPANRVDFQLQSSQKSNRFAEVISKEATEKEKENEDTEMEAVMLLARHFKEEKQILCDLDTNTACACVKKKIRERSTQSDNKPVTKTSSKTTTKHAVKKNTKEKLENAFCLVQMRSFTPMKATTSAGFQSHIEMSMMKAVGVGPDGRSCAALVCSINRNPADFSMPNAENKFMRGG